MEFNKHLADIKSYEAGKPIELVVREFGIDPKDIVKLASNENPFGCSQKVQDAVSGIVKNMVLYPDDSMLKLKNALAKKYDVEQKTLSLVLGVIKLLSF